MKINKSVKLFLMCFSLGFTLFGIGLLAQSKIYVPRNVLEAYKKGTRSFDGKPGPNYWQNSSDYEINVSVDPVTHLVSGTENIVYHNNSPDSLPYIVFRLYQDMNKPDAARNSELDEKAITKGDIIDELRINGSQVDVNSSSSVKVKDTNLYLYLDKPMPAKSTINFYFKWHFTIPAGNNPRMGMYDSTSFFIGYWYPQVAVYDDIDGWDKYNYTGTQEFYNDFSNFDVKISVPDSFGVWGTGILQNPDEVLTSKYLTRYNDAHLSDSVINIVTEKDIRNGNIYSNENPLNTWHFKADSVTDFAFGMSDHYLWDGVSLVMNNQNRRVYIATVYRAQSKDFHNVCKIARDAINYFSTVLPGIPFPYSSMTVFNGHSGGMEYPMIVNDGSYKEYQRTVYVTSHEISHTYFPFYMGINERKYAWMDEGMATFIPYKFQLQEGRADYTARDAFIYSRFAGNETDMPPITPSVFLENMPYTTASYMRPGLAYYFLEDALGEQDFTRIFQGYINRWHGKHPLPYDFFFTFDNLYGENLSWFWLPWFFQRGYPDLGIKKVEENGNNLKIMIKKYGNVPIPIEIKIMGKGDQNTSVYRSVMIWKDGSDSVWISKALDFKPNELMLGDRDIPDVNLINNFYELKDKDKSSEDSDKK